MTQEEAKPSPAPSGAGNTFAEQVALANLQAAISDVATFRTLMQQVYSWSTVSLAAVFAGGLAIMGDNDFFANPRDWNHALVVFLVFGAVVPGLATAGGFVFLTEVARMLQARLLTEAYERAIAASLREGRPPPPLLFRERVYFQWQERSLAGAKRGGADVTRNGYRASVAIYGAAIAAGNLTATLVLFPSDLFRDYPLFRPAIILWAFATTGYLVRLLFNHSVAVRALMGGDLRIDPDE